MSEASVRLGLTRSLRSLTCQKFSQGLNSKSLIFSDTRLAVLRSPADIPFQLRYCPGLSKKPTDSKQQSTERTSPPPKKRFDPFENPSEDLLISRIPNTDDYTHNLVLNKYPVIANHFILATRENKPQTDTLEEADVYLAYTCINAWHDDKQHSLYAFFNSGEHSGASQPHRHLQFLPVEDMRGSSTGSEWDLLCLHTLALSPADAQVFFDPSIPVLHLAARLDLEMTSEQLHSKYLLLLDITSELLESPSRSLDDAILRATTLPTDSSVRDRPNFSYNLAMTDKVMTIMPRRADDASIPELARRNDGLGRVSINGTILAGTFMVKNEEEWEVLKSKPYMVDEMLMQIGYPRDGSTPHSGIRQSL